MPVCNEIFSELAQVFHLYTQSESDETFYKTNRKQIKVLVDSLWEQIVENLFGVKPRNCTDARQIINNRKAGLTSADDMAVVEALLVVLRDYDVLIDTNYIDITKKMTPVFTINLKGVCSALTQHSSHRFDEKATKLSILLGKI